MVTSKIPFNGGSDYILGSISDPITNLSQIPVGTSGQVVLSDDIKPKPEVTTYVYACFGVSEGMRILFVALTTTSTTLYYSVRNASGTWRAWKTVTAT